MFDEGLAPGEVDLKNSTQETFQHYLSESGLKSTLQRNIILDTFFSSTVTSGSMISATFTIFCGAVLNRFKVLSSKFQVKH